MDSSQVRSGLDRLFANGARIVFWRDEDGEFEEMLPALDLEGVALRNLADVPALALKTEIELEKPEASFLLYEKGPMPEAEKDWLLDVRFYAEPFAADRSTMILRELGLMEQSLRDHIAARGKFFASKERLSRAKRFIEVGDDADAIDRALMATVLRAEQTDIFTIVRSLLHTLEPLDLEASPAAWQEFEKYDLTESFWSQMREAFGFDDEAPTLKALLMRLFVTDFARGIDGACPKALAHLVLPKKGAANTVVCVGQWRDSAQLHTSYDELSTAISDLIKLADHLGGLDIEELRDARTFLATEKYIGHL